MDQHPRGGVAIALASFSGILGTFFMPSVPGFVLMLLPLLGYIVGITMALASSPRPKIDKPEAPAHEPVGLTPDEVDSLLAIVPEVTPETRAQLQLLINGLAREKSS